MIKAARSRMVIARKLNENPMVIARKSHRNRTKAGPKPGQSRTKAGPKPDGGAVSSLEGATVAATAFRTLGAALAEASRPTAGPGAKKA
ncbi:hypothetical protein [Paenibacillus chitinolyticus]|uniref:hypothetical protein n=1 Tax=Paenibacillus chitinolyticus TaxID=79263 RepID=UPI003D05B784